MVLRIVVALLPLCLCAFFIILEFIVNISFVTTLCLLLYYIKVLFKLQKVPFRDTERTFRSSEPPFRDLERPFRVTEYRFIRKRQNKFITNRK